MYTDVRESKAKISNLNIIHCRTGYTRVRQILGDVNQ